MQYDLSEIDLIAADIIPQLVHPVVLLKGSLGAGKTTLITSLAQQLGVTKGISSPTFSLVNEYQTPTLPLYHFDMYRLNDESEALDFGVEEYFYSGSYCFVEWPEQIPSLIPKNHSIIEIQVDAPSKRTLTITHTPL
jgi:tRNA threonylcarbamoyladenosine biosynthesis protein TsaE